jgi:hypothetical protein
MDACHACQPPPSCMPSGAPTSPATCGAGQVCGHTRAPHARHAQRRARLVARLADRQQRLPDGLLGAVADHDLVGAIAQPVLLAQLAQDGGAQRRRAGVGRVARDAQPAAVRHVPCADVGVCIMWGAAAGAPGRCAALLQWLAVAEHLAQLSATVRRDVCPAAVSVPPRSGKSTAARTTT